MRGLSSAVSAAALLSSSCILLRGRLPMCVNLEGSTRRSQWVCAVTRIEGMRPESVGRGKTRGTHGYPLADHVPQVGVLSLGGGVVLCACFDLFVLFVFWLFVFWLFVFWLFVCFVSFVCFFCLFPLFCMRVCCLFVYVFICCLFVYFRRVFATLVNKLVG